MFSIPEQFSAQFSSSLPQIQTQLQSQLNFVNSVAGKAVESAGKLATLNIHAAKASVEKSSATAKQLLHAKDAQEFFQLTSFQPASFDGLLEYGRELWAIAQETQSEWLKAANVAKEAPVAPPQLGSLVKAVKQIVVTEAEEAPAPKAKAKAKPAEADATEEEAGEPQPPIPAVASVTAAEEEKPAKAKAKPVH